MPNQDEYNTFLPAVASKFTGWTDFLDKNSLASLAKSATYSDVHKGKYESVVIHFYRSFKINAEIPLNDGTTLYTKASENFQDNKKSGLDVTYANVSTDLTKSPSEDAVFFLPNGGKTFYLQSPFEITADDLTAKTSFKMVLAYDPNNIIKGNGIQKGPITGDFLTGQSDVTNGYTIQAPFLEFAPVVARQSETIIKESYLLYSKAPETKTQNTPVPQSAYSVRVTLYSVKEDPTNAIRGLTTALVYGSDTDSSLNYNTLGGIKQVVTNGDGTLNLSQGITDMFALKNFKRLTEKGVVESVSGTICTGGMKDGACDGGKTAPLNFTYTLLGKVPVDDTLTVAYTPTPAPTPTSTATPAPTATP